VFELDNKKMASVVSSFQVPVKPEILTKIQNIMDDDEPKIEEISALISSDVGLSAAIIKIINSPFYGMNRRISEIKQAVMMLGLKTINGLVTALLLKYSFTGETCISLERFWDDALDIANAMSFIGNIVKNEVPVDMLYSIGLFHDCGIPLLALKYPNYEDVLKEANHLNTNSVALEEKHYQISHTVLGYYVASSWHLPKEICQLIAQHHDSDYLTYTQDPQERLIYAILKIAENMIAKATSKNESPDWSEVQESVLEVVGLSPTDYIDLEDEFSEHFHN
jgi:HD-like signal output (HDOD) protein